jgi:hypothetical protein
MENYIFIASGTRYFMHNESGDIATMEEWRDDFENMDVESWYGLPAEECEGLHWIEGGHLTEVQHIGGEWYEL